MTALITAIFAATYAGMALGRVPGLTIDRTGIALVAAVILAASGAIAPDGIAGAIHFPTLLLLGGLMIVSGRVRAAGIYDAVAARIAERAGEPRVLLAATIAAGGLLSAVLVNDVVVFALTPLICRGLAARGVDPRPHLFGLAAASNAGSAATLIGNPQNIMIGQVGRLHFLDYTLAAALPALGGLAIAYLVIARVWRDALDRPAGPPADTSPPVHDRRGAMLCAAALMVLLALFLTPLPRELSALIVAAVLLVSRGVESRRLIGEIDLPLIILFASLFVVNASFAATGIPLDALRALEGWGLLPERLSLLAPLALAASNTIGNVPAVVMILEIWRGIPTGTLIGLAVLSTLAGNLLLVGSFANLIVAEQAAVCGVRLGFADHARAGIPVTLLSMGLACVWLWATGYMAM
ncbi:MAG: SLC13 family permease [Flavobacteriaceae bacterium]